MRIWCGGWSSTSTPKLVGRLAPSRSYRTFEPPYHPIDPVRFLDGAARPPAVNEVAQTAACIGRDFDYQLLKAISPLDDAALQDALERLTGAELIFRRGVPPDATYLQARAGPRCRVREPAENPPPHHPRQIGRSAGGDRGRA